MLEAFGWWLAVEILGLVGLPFALLLFRRLPSAGYAFAKPLGLLLGGYFFWLVLSLHILPNRPGTAVLVYLLLAVVALRLFHVRRQEMVETLQERWQLIIAVEIVFTVGFFLAVYLRSFIPEIDGTEKPMDFMILNAASHSRYYPPADSWLAGHGISYYYFGYVIQAMLGHLTAVPTSVAYNLGLGSTAALAATAAFGLGYDLVSLVKARIGLALAAGACAALLLTVLGNLEGALEFAAANGLVSAHFLGSVGVSGLAAAKHSNTWYPTESSSFWWWWRATRISPDANSITEFPFFSFLLGDLHPHVMAIPFVLTVVGLAVAFWRSAEALTFAYWRERPALLVVAGLVLGGLAFLNTWDLPTFAFLLALLVFARNLVGAAELPDVSSAGAASEVPPWRAVQVTNRWLDERSGSFWKALVHTVLFCLPLFVIAALAYEPFYVSFSSQAHGFEAVTTSATRPLHAALFWAPLLLLTVPVALIALSRTSDGRAGRRARILAAIPVALLGLWALLIAAHGDSLSKAISVRGWNWLTALFFGGAFVVSATALWQALERETSDENPGLVPALALMSVALLLVYGSELFYILDVFGSRLNTVFKLYYQAWIMLAIGGAFGAYWLLERWQAAERPALEMARGAWGAAALLALAGAVLYPLGATLSRTHGLSGHRTLDGLAFAKTGDHDNFAGVQWLQSHANHSDVLAEGIGGEYTDASRVSEWTAIPAVLGWAGHERQWHTESFWPRIDQRAADVDKAYSTGDLAEAVSLLRKYGVTYVVVGAVERSKYPAAGLQKFSALDPVYNAGKVAIYRVPASVGSSEAATR